MTVRCLLWLLVLGVLASAQESPPTSAPHGATTQPSTEEESSPTEKEDTPKSKAKELLESAAEVAAAVRPEAQVAGLIHLADTYR